MFEVIDKKIITFYAPKVCLSGPMLRIKTLDELIFINVLNTVQWVIFHAFCRLLLFFKSNFFEKLFQEYHQSVKQFGSRSGPTFCQA